MCGFLLSVFTLLMLPGCGSSPKSHDLSGYVTAYGLPVAGATVTLSGATFRTTTTDANGYYVFSGVDDGNYALSPPLLAGHVFSPQSIPIAMSGANGYSLNFVGTSVGILSTTLHTVYMDSGYIRFDMG